jgi:hypothetical protein
VLFVPEIDTLRSAEMGSIKTAWLFAILSAISTAVIILERRNNLYFIGAKGFVRVALGLYWFTLSGLFIFAGGWSKRYATSQDLS